MEAVVADADVLFGATTRGLLMYLDYQGLIELHWSPLILAELSRALVASGRKKSVDEARSHETLMNDSLPRAIVSTRTVQAHFKGVGGAVRSTKDIHVAACARSLVHAVTHRGHRDVALVTRNTRDFRTRELAALGVLVRKPDPFLVALAERSPLAFALAFQSFRRDLRTRPSVEWLLDRLARDGQSQTANALLERHRAGLLDL